MKDARRIVPLFTVLLVLICVVNVINSIFRVEHPTRLTLSLLHLSMMSEQQAETYAEQFFDQYLPSESRSRIKEIELKEQNYIIYSSVWDTWIHGKRSIEPAICRRDSAGRRRWCCFNLME